MSRRYDLRRLHAHRTYQAKELAQVLRVNIGTIRRWRKLGLQPIDGGVPHLFLGEHVRLFLGARVKPRQPCGPGRLYCTPCREPREPLGGLFRIVPRSATAVDLSAPCAACQHQMFQRVRIADIASKLGSAAIAREDETIPISGSGGSPQSELGEELAA